MEFNGVSAKGLKLFVEEAIPAGFWSPLGSPPFEKLSHLPQFRGFDIRPSKQKTRIDVGDVPVKIRYAKVVIDLTKAWVDKQRPNSEQLKQLALTVHDRQGKIIYDGRVPESAIDLASSSLNLALTKGRWTVQLSLPSQTGRLRSPRRSIDLKDTTPIRIYLN